MKKLIMVTLFLLTGITAWAQITLTAGGKKVEKLTCDMNDVNFSVPLPANYKGYELINIIVERQIPEFAEGAQIEPGGFFKEYSSSFYDGKNKIDVALIKPNGESDLVFNGKSHSVLAVTTFYSLSSACNDTKRDYTYVKNVVSIRGAKHTGYEWQGNVKVKTYKYDVLKTYTFNLQIGPLNTFYIGAGQKFRIDKVTSGEANNINSGLKGSVVYTDTSSQNNGLNRGTVVIRSQILTSKETDVETAKTGVQFKIIRTSNPPFSLNGYDIPFDHSYAYRIGHVYLPVVGATKSKSRKDTEADIKKIMDKQNEFFNWTKIMLDGVEFNKLEIDVYQDTQIGSNNDNWATYLIKGQKGKTRKLVVLIGQKGEDIYCLAIFKSESDGLTTNEAAFFQNVEKTFKFSK